MQPADGFFFTEPWVGLHNGDFDLFNDGERATPGLESLAEGGNTELLGSEFAAPGRLQATVGNGEVQFISPGEIIEGSIDIRNAANYRYASIASMIIPSNDGFFGNEDPFAYEVFDENGNPTGDIEITIYGQDIYDSGTEVNDAQGAAGFSLGPNGDDGGESTDDPEGLVSLHPDLFANIVGIQTAAGTTVGSDGSGSIAPDEAVARITISVGDSINTQAAVGPVFEGSIVADDAPVEEAPVEEAPVEEAPAGDAVRFTFENLQPADGFFFTEPWVGLHNGDFDLFNDGERATPGLESLAEGGNTELLGSEFAAPGRLQATVGNGEVQFISPGEIIEGSIDIRNAANYRYASIASMIIPSNDGFFGNEDPFAYEVFDENGNPTGDIEITIYGQDIYDSGTEVNDAQGAAGFSLGPNGDDGGESTDDPEGLVSLHPDLFANIVGIQTAAGTTVGSDGSGSIAPDEAVARITISVGDSINTQAAVGPVFEGSIVADDAPVDDAPVEEAPVDDAPVDAAPGSFRIVDGEYNRYLEASFGNASTTNVAHTTTEWDVVPTGDGAFYIQNTYTRRFLDADASNVGLADSPEEGIRWTLEDAGDGSYYIVNETFGTLLNADRPGFNVNTSSDPAPSTSWTLVPTESDSFPDSIALPDGFTPEGITLDGTTGYVGSLTSGAIQQFDVRTGESTEFAPATDDGGPSLGLAVDNDGRLWVAAGGPVPGLFPDAVAGYRVYDTDTGDLLIDQDLPNVGLVNDVWITGDAAWLTDSFSPNLIRVPIASDGTIGEAELVAIAGEWVQPEGFGANGIVATQDEAYLIVAQATGPENDGSSALYVLPLDNDASSLDATRIELDEALLGGDGLVLDDRTLYVVGGPGVTEIQLSDSLTSGDVQGVLTVPDAITPTTAAAFGSQLYVVDANFPAFGTPGTPFQVTAISR